MSDKPLNSGHDDADSIKKFTDQIKLKLSTLRESRQEDVRLISLQNEPYIDVWCDKVSIDTNDFGSPSLKSVVLDFLKNLTEEVRTLNVFGEAGAGKSIAMLKIELALWDILEIDKIGLVPQFFPIFMILKTTTYPMYHVLPFRDVALHSLGSILTVEDLDQLKQLKSQLKLSPVWILDGFDEMGRMRPICADLYECGISIVTCRQQFLDSVLGGNFEKYLVPKDAQGNRQGHYEQVRLLPFTSEQIHEYVEKWVELSSKRETESKYETYQMNRVLRVFPNLKELSHNPYLLALLCTLMPTFAEKHPLVKEVLELPSHNYGTDQDSQCFGISDIFKILVDAFIAKGMSRCVDQSDWTEKMCDEFQNACQYFCENVAFEMFEAKEKTYIIDITEAKDSSHKFITGKYSYSLKALLQCIPFSKVGDSSLYAFPHKSLWEYFLACRSMRLPAETLGHELFTQDRDLLLVHAELLAQREGSVEEYIKVVLSSRHKCEDAAEDKRHVTAASNAMSILNFAAADNLIPFQFEDIRDWKGIRVPGVNLNHAKILRCEFDGANFSGASLMRTFVLESSFKHVDLRGATCGIKATLKGHTGSVNSIAMQGSSEGTILASGSMDLSVRIWNIETGECKFISPQAERLWDSPMHSIVAFTSRASNCIFLWNSNSRTFCGVLEGHSRIVECFNFSPNGKTGASGSEDGTVRVWSIADNSSIQILKTNTPVNSVSFSPDGDKLVSTSSDLIHFWDINTGKCSKKIKIEYSANVLYHPSGKVIALFNQLISTIEILDAETAEKISSITVGGNVSKISFLPNGQLVILAKHLEVWDIESNTCLRTAGEKTDSYSTLALSRDFSLAVTVSSSDNEGDKDGAYGGTFNIWDMKAFKLLSSFERGANTPNSICISHDNTSIIAAYSTCGTFSVWDMGTGKETKINLGHVDNVESVAFHPGSTTPILATSSEKGFRLWNKDDNRDSWSCFYRIKGGVGLSRIAFSPDGRVIVGSDAGRFVVYDYAKEKIIRTLSGRGRPEFAVFSPDGRFFACISDFNKGVDIFETETRKFIREIHTKYVCYRVSFSPDGRTIACVIAAGGITLIDWETGKSLIQLGGYARLISFHPTNNHLLASTDSGRIRLWDTLSGKCIVTLVGHVGAIDSLCFSSDGSTLASGGDNGSILLWDLTTNYCLPKISSKKSPDLESVCLSPDARTLAAGGEGLFLYGVQTNKLISTLMPSDYSINHISFNSDGSLLLYSIDEEMVEIRNLKTNKSLRRFAGTMPSYNPDCTKILYVEEAICVWNIAKSKRSLSIDFVDGDALADVCFSPDGNMIIASFEDSKKVHFWNSKNGKKIKTMDAFWEGCKLNMSPNGKIMTFSGFDILEIWSLTKLEAMLSFHDCENPKFSSDGNKLAFSRNKSVILFDVVTMKLIASFEGHSSDVMCIHIHPDGQYVVSCCTDMIFIWDLETLKAHSVIGVNKTIQIDCDLQGAQLDESFRKTLSDLSAHLFSTRIDIVNPCFTPFDKEQMHACFQADEMKMSE